MGREYESVLVLGLGVSGESAARLLLAEGSRVTAVDSGAGAVLASRADTLKRQGARVLLGSEAESAMAEAAGTGSWRLGTFDACVVSPGIPAGGPWVQGVESRGVEAISEMELGYRRCRCAVLAVTGSNGKSTMVKLCTEALAAGGLRAAWAGNYGTGLCDAASRSGDLDWVVVEVSSFQLERVREFRPRVGVLLNLQPNHLDRHGDMATYVEIKTRLFRRMGEDDTGIVADDISGDIRGMCGGKNRWVTFGCSEAAAYRYVPGSVHVAGTGRKASPRSVSVAGTLFDNPVLGSTAAAAAAAGEACGLDLKTVEQAIRSFEPLPHRMQKVAEFRGVLFVNDSKATTLSAMQAALRMAPAPVRLIAGGLLKEKDLEFVKEALARKAVKVYLIGAAGEEMRAAWEGVVACSICGDLGTAVRAAWGEARAGETVLLSPGCASFDQFQNFEQRGERFVEYVSALQET